MGEGGGELFGGDGAFERGRDHPVGIDHEYPGFRREAPLSRRRDQDEVFKSFGIEPEGKHVIALKSMQHFRAAFEPIAGKVIVCDSGALCTLHYERLPYKNVPRPIFPLDDDAIGDRQPGIDGL